MSMNPLGFPDLGLQLYDVSFCGSWFNLARVSFLITTIVYMTAIKDES